MEVHPPLSPTAYSRIYEVIYSVLQGTGNRTPRSCMFFSQAGAQIMRQHHGLNARAVAGGAVYRVEPETAATFGRVTQDNRLDEFDQAAFHCWVESDGVAIDFMAPVFRENLHGSGHESSAPRKMFQ